MILCSLEWMITWMITHAVFPAMRSMISWWINYFVSLFITFRTNFRMSIIPSPCSFFFALHLEWSLDLRTVKKQNAICLFANLCSTLFSLPFTFSSAWFYFLSKYALTEKNLNVDSSSKMQSIFFDATQFNLIEVGESNTNS